MRDREPTHLRLNPARIQNYMQLVTPLDRPMARSVAMRAVSACAALCLALCLTPVARAQISLTTAVDLALRSNPRVLGAQDDVKRAQQQLSETRDVYIPAINLGANFGQAYGYLPNPPTFFEVTAGSLAYSASQHDYIRSAHAGVTAARLALNDVREGVAQDTILAFLALDHDQQRDQAIQQEVDYAGSLVRIVQQRLDAGQDSPINLTQAKLTAAQLRLAELTAGDAVVSDREHLARLIGLPSAGLSIDPRFPAVNLPVESPDAAGSGYANTGIASAFANARAKQLQAKGDSTFRFRPQINFVVNYQRYATFTNSFKDLEKVYQGANGHTLLTSNETAFGVQITLPFYDRGRSDRAKEAEAVAARAFHDAQNEQIEALDGESRTRHSITELQAQADVATLQQQLAQQQLDVLRTQLKAGTGNPNGPEMTPKDEQNALISERDKYLAVVDAGFQLHQAEVQLLRQSDELQSWLKSVLSAPAIASPPSNLPPSPTPQP